MAEGKRLPAADLYRPCDPEQFSFATTAEIDPLDEIVGPSRDQEAIAIGLEIDSEGFNIFALGPNGRGKDTAVRQFPEAQAAMRPPPDDWCYAYNFDEPHRPGALCLQSGQGTGLRTYMSCLTEGLSVAMPAALSSAECQTQKRAIQTEIKSREDQAIEGLREEALGNGTGMLRTPFGFVFAPLKGTEVITPDEFLRLPDEEHQRVEAEVEQLYEALRHIAYQAPQWQRELQERLKQLREDMATRTVVPLFEEVPAAYASLPDALAYFDAAHADVIASLLNDAEDGQDSVKAGLEAHCTQPLVNRNQVNVVVDNQETRGATGETGRNPA